MPRNRKGYRFLLDLAIVEGCFTSISDLMDYIRYRINIGRSETESIVLKDICLVGESCSEAEKESV